MCSFKEASSPQLPLPWRHPHSNHGLAPASSMVKRRVKAEEWVWAECFVVASPARADYVLPHVVWCLNEAQGETFQMLFIRTTVLCGFSSTPQFQVHPQLIAQSLCCLCAILWSKSDLHESNTVASTYKALLTNHPPSFCFYFRHPQLRFRELQSSSVGGTTQAPSSGGLWVRRGQGRERNAPEGQCQTVVRIIGGRRNDHGDVVNQTARQQPSLWCVSCPVFYNSLTTLVPQSRVNTDFTQFVGFWSLPGGKP